MIQYTYGGVSMWKLFEVLVVKKFTVRRIREEMSVAGYDLSAYDDPYLIRRMLEVSVDVAT